MPKIIYTPPPDKSITIRAMVISSLIKGKTKIINPLISDDTTATIKNLKKLGVQIKKTRKYIIVKGVGLYGFKKSDIDVGESALFLRLILPVLLNQKHSYYIKGKKTILKRNFKETLIAFKKMGAKIEHNNYFLPFKTYPSILKSITYKTTSAQTKSSLLIASLYTNGIKVIDFQKTRDHGERILEYLGCKIKKKKNTIELVEKKLKSKDIIIPGDISQASVFITLSIFLNKNIIIKNCLINKTRMGFIDAIKKMGCRIKYINKKYISNEAISDICIYPPKDLKPIIIRNITPLIDEVMFLSLLCSKANGKSIIEGIKIIENKESNRYKKIVEILSNLGIRLKKENNRLIIYGPNEFKKIDFIDTSYDHRIAMLAGIIETIQGKKIKIKNRNCVKKTYPDFWKSLNQF